MSYALDVRIYGTTFNLVGDRAVVEFDIILNENSSEDIHFNLPADYKALSAYIDGKAVLPVIEEDVLGISLNHSSRVKFNYITREFIDKGNFLMNMRLDFDADNLVVKLVLPEGASLKKPIKEGDITSGSIYPKPDKATTDGKSLIFYWIKQDMKEGEEISIFTQIKPEKPYFGIIIGLIVLIVLAGGGLYYALSRKPKTKVVVKKKDMYEKHLKEEEEQIVNVLKQRNGQCEQGTLRIVTGMSKATLSRLLSELEARKIVKKEKRGKKNIVFLKE
jgi:hypothetical protein